jgi:hypothetical protein
MKKLTLDYGMHKSSKKKNEEPRFRIISSQELNGNNVKGPLSKHAGLVNRMLIKGMTQADIAQITGKPAIN